MPSSKNYKRDYKAERLAEKPKRRKDRAKRNTARRQAIKAGKVKKGDKSKHVDHKKPLRSGGTNAKKNVRIQSASKNSSANGHRKGETQRRKKK